MHTNKCEVCYTTFEHAINLINHKRAYKNGTCLSVKGIRTTPQVKRVAVNPPAAATPTKDISAASASANVTVSSRVPQQDEACVPDAAKLHNEWSSEMQFMKIVTEANSKRGLPMSDIANFLDFIQHVKENPLIEFTNASQYLTWLGNMRSAYMEKEGYNIKVISVDSTDVPALGNMRPIQGTFFCLDLMHWLKGLFADPKLKDHLVLYPEQCNDSTQQKNRYLSSF